MFCAPDLLISMSRIILLMPDFMPNVNGTVALLLNEKYKTWAMVPVLKSKAMEICYVELCTEFSGQNELCTNNSTQLQAFIKTPAEKMLQFPKMKDLKILFKLHGHLKNIFITDDINPPAPFFQAHGLPLPFPALF
jgi:hypothetical protein